jgi:7,8-dihydropterin-6-yl-methyl-4-(beta-D-ribofuranosyl)aminobenzene 5'-phosphate synthase
MKRWFLRGVALAVLVGATTGRLPAQPSAARAKAVKITVLSTMLADTEGVGEWGFAALVEVDGQRILFDTGARQDTVLRNAEELKVDLTGITDVILSHHHGDHTGGLLKLRQTLGSRNSSALSRAHVARGIFEPRRSKDEKKDGNPMPALRGDYEATGAKMIEHAEAGMLAPGVWLTGPVARRYPERNWAKGASITSASGLVEDTIPEDMSLVIDAEGGLIVITGCGHAGIGNILAQAREMVPGVSVRSVVGGLHLLDADEKSLSWTAKQMRKAGVEYLLGAHCTGLEAVYRLRELLGLDRRTAVVGAVGSSYSSVTGLDPRWLAH